MQNKNKRCKGVFVALLGAAFLTGCGTAAEPSGSTAPETGSAASETGTGHEGAESGGAALKSTAAADTVSGQPDYTDTYDDSAVKLVLDGDTVSAEGGEALPAGVEYSDGSLVITEAGDYVLCGTLNGQVLVDATAEDAVHLYLENAEITCDNSAAIMGSQSDYLVVTLVQGTVNTVSDAAAYTYENAEDTEPNAAIFSKDDLIFNGTGTLIVNGNYADGIRSKDDLIICGGNYEVQAVSDALQGKDSVEIYDGTFVVDAGNDGVKASNDTDSEKGYVTIYGGSFTVRAGDDAFHAETAMRVDGGEITVAESYEGMEGLTVEINGGKISVTATDDGINAAGGSDSGESFFGGGMSGGSSDAVITVNGGEIYVNAEGDGVDSNGTIVVNGGTLFVDGPTNDGNGALDCELGAQISGGTVVAAGSAGMATGFDSTSAQASILYNFGAWMAAGETVTVTDSNGMEIISYAPQKAYQSVVISCAELTDGERYTITCGDESAEITLSGNTYSNGQGGMNGRGGMHGMDGQGGMNGRGEMNGRIE